MQRERNERTKQRINNQIREFPAFLQLIVLLYVLWVLFVTWCIRKLKSVRPVQMLVPLSTFQIILLIAGTLFDNLIIPFAGCLFLTGIAIVPGALQNTEYKAHWVTRGR